MHRVLPALAILAALAAHSSAATTAPETPGAEKRTKQQRVEAALEARIQAAFVNNEAAIQAFNQHINKTLTKDSQRYAARVTAVELMEALRRGEVVPDRKAARSQLDGLIEQKAANIVNVIQSPPARVEQTGNLVQPPSEGPVTPGRSGRQDIAPNEIAQVAREAMAQGVKASQPTPMVQTPIDVPPMVAPGLPNTTALPPASGAPTTGSRTPPTGESVPTPEELLGRWFVDRNPRDGVAREILARNAWRRADYQTVYEETRNAIANGRVGPANFLMRGLAAEHLGDYEQANRDAQVTLQFDPANRRARDLLHMTEGKASAVRLAEAQAPWAASARDDEGPGGPSGQAGSGPQPSAALPAAADPAAVIAAIQGRGAGTPRQAAANLVREARRYLDVKDARMAIAIATRALDLDPKNAAAYHVRAVAQSQTGRLEDSVRDASLSLALVTPKEGFPALKTRAWAYNGLRKFDDALKDSLQAKSIKPGDGFVLMTEARALGGLGRREEMVSRLKEAAAAEPDRYQGLYEAALELPSDADTETLFTGLPASARGGPAKPSRGGTWHKLRLLVYCLAGGLLIALGLSHKDVAERATTTARRLLTGAPAVDGAEPAPAAPAPATNFWSRYDGAREIAKGGMGIVFEATDKNLGRRVAVKKMREELRTDPRERERFLKEARTVASLQHPNVVQIFEVAEDGLDAYLVFEYVDGETLHDRLRRLKRLTLPDTAKILAGVCAAVECAHGRAMTHRDLKPSNIMIDRDGRVKVMDFGIARHAKDALTKLSMTNTVCGTPPYMAPEQEQGMVCKESDVFSLGVLAYELLSGTLPFEGAPGAMLLAKMSGRYEPVSKRVKDLPAGVDDPLARALCPDPAKRYRRPSELAAALEALSSAVRA